MATFTAVEQRAYIKIEYYRDTKRVKILNTLKSVCGKDALPKTTVYRWTDEFKKGRLTDTERRTLTIVIAPPKYSSGELNMDAPKY